MEAWTIRRPIDEIKEQCRDMLAVVKKRKNWNDAGGVLEALRTVQQLLTSYEKQMNGIISSRKINAYLLSYHLKEL